jgi:deoxyribonuclease IV
MTQRWIGAHVSASGGIHLAVERAKMIGANCVQIFSGSPRVWARKPLEEVETDRFVEVAKAAEFGPTITHSLYLVNLASENPASVEKSINGLVYDLKFDSAIEGGGVVVHLGSHQGRGWEAVKEQVVKAVAEILEKTPENSTFLIENSAGQQGKLCSELGEIRWLLDQLQSSRVGWCFDTCHATCAGYALGEHQPTASEKLELRPFTARQALDQFSLWETLKCIHVNDARDPFGSGRDRHANLGEGVIPPEDMQYFLNLPELHNVPSILEVPGLDNLGPDKANVDRLKALLK